MRNVCVFCGSSPGARPVYAEAAREMGRLLAARNLGLVYGGGAVGLMGIVADAVLDAGGAVVGVIPQALADREIAHRGLTELHVVQSMHQRKALMASRADVFVAMPGGFGTYEEFFEAVTWTQLGVHRKPCGLLNVEGFYDPLIQFLDLAEHERFVRPSHRATVVAEATPDALLDRLAAVVLPDLPKWIDVGES